MILQLDEAEYRARPELSQSQLKDFWKNSRMFHKKYILKEPVKEEDENTKQAMLYGNVVDCLLTKEEEFDYKFIIGEQELPKGQMFDFCCALYKYTLMYTRDGILALSMDELYEMAYKDAGFKRDTLEKVKERFIEEGLPYYTSLRDRGDKLAITQSMYEKATYLVERLRTHPYCCNLITMSNSDRWTVHDQIMVTGTLRETNMRAMLDRVIVDNKNKIVFPWDYKIGSNAEMFKINYTKLGYYAQLGVYTELLRQNFPDHKVEPLRFLAVDATMFFDPVKWKTTEQHVDQAFKGFRLHGRTYPGINEMLDSYNYCCENNYWTGSATAHKMKGEVELEIFENL